MSADSDRAYMEQQARDGKSRLLITYDPDTGNTEVSGCAGATALALGMCEDAKRLIVAVAVAKAQANQPRVLTARIPPPGA